MGGKQRGRGNNIPSSKASMCNGPEVGRKTWHHGIKWTERDEAGEWGPGVLVTELRSLVFEEQRENHRTGWAKGSTLSLSSPLLPSLSPSFRRFWSLSSLWLSKPRWTDTIAQHFFRGRCCVTLVFITYTPMWKAVLTEQKLLHHCIKRFAPPSLQIMKAGGFPSPFRCLSDRTFCTQK